MTRSDDWLWRRPRRSRRS